MQGRSAQYKTTQCRTGRPGRGSDRTNAALYQYRAGLRYIGPVHTIQDQTQEKRTRPHQPTSGPSNVEPDRTI